MKWMTVPAFLFGLSLAQTMGSGPALAHPHVWVSAQSTVLFDAAQMTRVRHVWTFDEVFSAFAIQGLDANGDGIYSREELQELAQVNVTSLEEFDFFTFAHHGDTELTFSEPVNYWLVYDGGQLTLHFDLPLAAPVRVSEELVVDVYDSTFFVDFGFADQQPALVQGNESCAAKIVRPQDLPVDVLDRLSALPPEIRDLPPELQSFAESLVNGIHISCS